ncbi:MAG: oxidoreductase, partial [Actinobacteria bacterium]|nr:oxidoreductase [Actinomycetota bacterium]
GWPTVAPSDVEFEGLRRPTALLLEEIAAVEAAFLAAAERAVRAGVDMVEIHAAHGYLLHQFLSPFANVRTDEFGGSLGNRARMLRRIVSGMRTRHPRLAISVRISATEWIPGGFDLDEARRILPLLAQDGADFISVTTAGNHADAPIPDGPGYQVPFAAGLSELDTLPIGVAGNIDRAEQAEQILAEGHADAVLLGRPLLGDPFLPLRWAHRLGVEGARSLVPDPYSRADFS